MNPRLLLLFCFFGVSASAEPPAPWQPPKSVSADELDPAELATFMRQLADEVFENHVVRDESGRTFGMTYEYLDRENRKVQDFGLDTMHDGAWFMSALISAERVAPDGEYLERALRYQIPFYVNILQNSDRIFPDMKPREGQERFTAPVKGWCPRGWDDGLGIDLFGNSFGSMDFWEKMRHESKKADTRIEKDGDSITHSYFTSSHHLLQDLADALLNVWLTTRDPEVAAAVEQIHQTRLDHGHVVTVIRNAASLVSSDAESENAASFSPTGMRPYYAGAYLQKPERIAAYDDGTAWFFRDQCARAALSEDGEFDPEAAWRVAGTAYSLMTAMEAYHGGVEYQYGEWFFDLGGSPGSFIDGAGRLHRYFEDGEPIFGARGAQIAAFAAAILPVVRANPEIWERRYHDEFADSDVLVRIVDSPGDDAAKVDFGDGKVISLVSDPLNLHLEIEGEKKDMTLRFGMVEDPAISGERREAVIKIANGKVSVTNDKGQQLLVDAKATEGRTKIRIPYAIVRSQAAWANGVDHGRYFLAMDGGGDKTLYFLSEPQRVCDRLEALVTGTIDFWQKRWAEDPRIPTAYFRSGKSFSWGKYADAGNYAHLMKTIAGFLAYRADTTDWDLIRSQAPAEPVRFDSLPKTVLEAQGL